MEFGGREAVTRTDERRGATVLALVGAGDPALVPALASLGRVERVGAVEGVDPRVHEVAVVDCRGGGGERSLARLAPQPVVVLAVVEPDAVDAPDACADADEIVTLAELATPSARWRLARRLARHRAPFALSRRWQPERAVLQAIADHSSDWLFIKDLEHRFVLAGDAFARSVGRPLSRIHGEDDLGIGIGEEAVLGDARHGRPGFWALDDDAIARGVVTREENPDGQPFTESPRQKRVLRVPLVNARGEVHALLVCSQDVTRVLAAEHALAEGRVRLDAESRAREAAERAAAERTRFLAATTHDLRQPLHAIGLFLESLAHELETPRQRDKLGKIRRGTETLAALFDALLDITRLDAALVEVDARDVALEGVLAPLREAFVAEGAEKGLTVSIAPSEAIVRTDPVLLGRVLRNLLHNAVRYTERGGVALETESLDAGLEIRVRDSGPGIEAAEHEAIFGEYYRAERAVRGEHSASGVGLGLAIVRRIAALLGLPLALESSPGHGATFSVRVPLGDDARVGTAAALETSVPIAAGRVVLVVDDEAAIREGMADVFRACGCEAVVAQDTGEAFAALAARELVPDVIVADHSLENDETGAGVIEAVRARYGVRVPGVIVTGDTAPERLHEARLRGHAFLHKPVAPQRLVRVVATLLGSAPTGATGTGSSRGADAAHGPARHLQPVREGAPGTATGESVPITGDDEGR